MDLVGVVSAIGQVASAVVAIPVGLVAWWSFKASKSAAEASRTMAAIEMRRDWADRIPLFKVTLTEETDSYAVLQVELVGPPVLDRLDEVRVSIRNDFHGRKGSGLAGAASDDEVASHVWGPFRFRSGIDGGSADGRSVEAFPLPLGEALKFAMDRQSPPRWNTSATTSSWAKDYDGKPVRLMLTCFRDGFELWNVPVEVFVKTRKQATPLASSSTPQLEATPSATESEDQTQPDSGGPGNNGSGAATSGV